MNLRPIAILIALTLSQTIAASAIACGPPEPEDIVENHFRALNAHDRSRVLAQWNENATVVSLGEPARIEPVQRAATRWVQTKQPVTFHIDKIDVADGIATAHVSVVFDGRKEDDTLLLAPARDGWRIAGMTSRIVPTKSDASY